MEETDDAYAGRQGKYAGWLVELVTSPPTASSRAVYELQSVNRQRS